MSYDAGNRNTVAVGRAAAAIDEGLRQYMLRVYNYMASGLALTGIVAWFTASSETLVRLIFGTPLFWVLFLGLFGYVVFIGARITRMSFAAAQLSFWSFAALFGLLLASIFVQYTTISVAQVFFITAGMFAAMSLYGYTTKRDLSGWGSFLFMGLGGIFIAFVANWWIGSPALHYAASAAGVIVFTGLTAYDTQSIKELYLESDSPEIAGKKTVMGALRLYLDFIGLLIMLMQFLGQRR